MVNTKKNKPFKPFEELTISDDYLFKRIMIEKDICMRFLESLLQVKIRDIKYIGVEQGFKETYLGKGIRLDVYVEDDKNTIYNIEMQTTSKDKKYLGKRIRYYQALIDSAILHRGEDYKNLKKLYIIFMCTFGLFRCKRQVYFFENYCSNDKNIKLEDGVTKILISTKGKEEKNLDKDLKAFIDYVNGILPDNDFVQIVNNRIGEIKQKESERSLYMQYELRLRDEREAGKLEGISLGEDRATVNNIKLFMQNGNLSAEQVMKILQIPEEEQGLYLRLLNDPVFYEEYFSEDKYDDEDEEEYDDYDEEDEE